MCCTALVGAMLSTAGQAQAMPGSDSGTPAAPNASTTTTSSTKDKVVLKVGDLQVTQATFERTIWIRHLMSCGSLPSTACRFCRMPSLPG